MSALLERFIRTFQKAISAEMEAMRQQLGPFEVPLGEGRALDKEEGEQGRLYTFKVLQANDKLVLQAECTLRYEGGELLVTVIDLNQAQITLRSDRPIGLNTGDYTLIIYPWFLYERLQAALAALLVTPEAFYCDNALTLFGQGQPRRQPQPLLAGHPGLNTSQLRAVQCCCDSSLAFVWGPPGTGKTTTLGHIISELLDQGQRLLVTSTTNAAVDQALAKLVGLPGMQPRFDRGQIVRIGHTNEETYGASLPQVVQRLNQETQARLERLREQGREAARQLRQCELLLDRLQAETQPVQLELFQEARPSPLTLWDLTPVFSDKLARRLVVYPAQQQQAQVMQRQQRLKMVQALAHQKAASLGQALRQQEVTVVQQARVILATMTNVYLSNLLQPERYDAVIVEEAGMAILPTLFYCAALARTRLVIVGDPQQLPPIVQSRDDYVYRAMGRNIFEVAASNGLDPEDRVMLDVQYRMHPVIGDLVSRLFYDGKLRHGENTRQRSEISGKPPYPGQPLVVIDTRGQTICMTEAGSFSRLNERTAQLCVDLALEAVQAGAGTVAIITPYVAQSRLIRRHLARFGQEAEQIECRTVHRFQGGERDVVILDTVDTAPLPPGVLLTGTAPGASSSNLLNVSISRARGKLILIADVSYFRRASPRSTINSVLEQAIKAGACLSIQESSQIVKNTFPFTNGQ